jgi:hypothetical protein
MGCWWGEGVAQAACNIASWGEKKRYVRNPVLPELPGFWVGVGFWVEVKKAIALP